jgi:hypothetical protein
MESAGTKAITAQNPANKTANNKGMQRRIMGSF